MKWSSILTQRFYFLVQKSKWHGFTQDSSEKKRSKEKNLMFTVESTRNKIIRLEFQVFVNNGNCNKPDAKMRGSPGCHSPSFSRRKKENAFLFWRSMFTGILMGTVVFSGECECECVSYCEIFLLFVFSGACLMCSRLREFPTNHHHLHASIPLALPLLSISTSRTCTMRRSRRLGLVDWEL